MKINTKLSLILCATIISMCFLSTINLSAYTPPQMQPYKIMLDGGNRVFCMTPAGQESDEHLRSGLYYNTDPPLNIYYVSGYFYHSPNSGQYGIMCSDDGTYFINFPRVLNLDNTAIEFFKNGTIIMSYTASFLLGDTINPTISMIPVPWENWYNREFNTKNNVLSVTTSAAQVYHFDVTTGELLSETELEDILSRPDVTSPGQYVPPTFGAPEPADLPLAMIALVTCSALLVITILGYVIAVRKRNNIQTKVDPNND